MENYCGECGRKTDKKTGLCPYCNKNELSAKKKKKIITAVIAVLCSICIVSGSVFGALLLFKKEPVEDVFGGYHSFAEGFTDVRVTDEKSAIKAVASVSDILGIQDAEKELKVVSVNTVGTDSYYRMQQYYNDIPVYGKSVVVSAAEDGTATALTANFSVISEEIEIKTTATENELKLALEKHLNVDNFDIEIISDNLVVYLKDNNEYVLAYELNILGQRIIIDANTSEILLTRNLYVQKNVMCEYADGVFTGIQISENEYMLGDEEKGIFVFTANHKKALKKENNSKIPIPERSLPMTSIDNYFGDDGDSFKSDDYIKGIFLLDVLQKMGKYYINLNESQNTSIIITMNDDYDPDNAFGGYLGISSVTTAKIPYEKERINAIYFGHELSADIENNLDTLGHEFAHGVNHSYFISDTEQSSAIDEAYADIFGELLESYFFERSPDWNHGERNMENPHNYKDAVDPYPDSVFDLENARTFNKDGQTWYRTTKNKGSDYSHFASTIVSHAAYLMWNGIDGTDARKIDSTTLGELWYRSLMFLQDNADFSQCRNAVELAARCMLRNEQLTDEQYKTVSTAFDNVGIDNAAFSFVETVKNKFDLNVLSNKGTENVNYKLEIIKMPEVKSGPGIINKMPELIDEINSLSGKQSLNLKDGIYLFRLSDTADKEDITEIISVKVIVDGDSTTAKNEIILNTDFTDVITVILNDDNDTSDKTENKPDENKDKTDAPSFELSPEDAVDIYMQHKDVWMNIPEYRPMCGYGYCLLDLDSDGVLELIQSICDGSGRYSNNKFYRINTTSSTVEEFFTDTVSEWNPGADFYYCSDEIKLLKNSADGSLFYLAVDHEHVSAQEGALYYIKCYMQGDKMYEQKLFRESWQPDYDNNDMTTQVRKYYYANSEIFQTEYEQKTQEFYSVNKDMNLSFNIINGNDFENVDDSIRSLLLLDAYRSFSYDGFLFDNSENPNSADNLYGRIKNGTILTLSGTIIKENYELNNENKGVVFIMNLEEPIVCAFEDEMLFYKGEEKYVESVQVNLSGGSLENYVGQNITITGKVMFAHTGHHRRDIVLTECILQ